ncbi:AsmA family protein [Endozoicomonas sp. Mp262]|uniref:AsmA family protein n=1 Tax=Endozoicomonas sp. Mp262 TaxID=2919499 RepID=UPI0021D94631
MNRTIKWIAMLLAGFILLMALAAVLLPKFIDPNNYRDDISHLIHKNTGLTVTINGSMGWSVFPWIGLSIEDVSIAGTDNSKLANLGNAEVSVKLLPLLSKKIEIQTARLNGLNLNLIRAKNGKGNWEIAQGTGKPEPETTAAEPSDQGKTSELTLDIASVEISDLTVQYDDQVSGNRYTLNQASLKTGAIRNQQPFDITINALVSAKEPALNLKTQLQSTITLNLNKNIYDLTNLVISLQPGQDDGESINLKGNIHFQQQPLLAKGQLNVSRFNLNKLLTQLNIQLPPMADKQALNQFSFNTSFKTDGKTLSSDNLDLNLDDFSLKGYLLVSDLKKQAISFKFTGNDLVLDNYLPPPAKQADASGKKKQQQQKAEATLATSNEQPLIPEDLLRPLNIKGSLSLASLTVAKLKFVQPALDLKAANGQQTIKLDSGFYQGSINVDGQLNVRQKGRPKANMTAALKGINLEAMATPVPALKTVQGVVKADLKMSTAGLLQSALTKNLNGSMSFNIDKGAFTEANFDRMVCEGIAKIRKKQLQKTDWGKVTPFQNLSGTFIVRNGIATNNDLTAVLSSLNLKGDGKVNLVQQTLDYHVGLNIRGDEAPDSDPACQINEDYVDVTWPVRCTGKLGEQSCGLDTERLAQTVAELAKKEAQKRIKKEIEKSVDGPLKDVLKGFFK